MVRVKAEMKCPYCGEVKAVSGMTSHVRHKHPEHYETDFKPNRVALVEKHKIVEGQPAPPPAAPAPPAETPPADPDPTPPSPPPEEDGPKPGPQDQQSGSFLGSVGKALRDW